MISVPTYLQLQIYVMILKQVRFDDDDDNDDDDDDTIDDTIDDTSDDDRNNGDDNALENIHFLFEINILITFSSSVSHQKSHLSHIYTQQRSYEYHHLLLLMYLLHFFIDCNIFTK